MMMVFGHRYNGIKKTRICLSLSFILSIQCCSTVTEIVLFLLFFLNSKRFGWFSKSMGLLSEQELLNHYSAKIIVIIIIVITTKYARQ
jgi:hypothetical protein